MHALLAAGGKSEIRREPALAHSYMRARHVSEPAMAGFQAIVEAIKRFTINRTACTGGSELLIVCQCRPDLR